MTVDARLRSLTPRYHTTLPSDAGRELPETGRTVDLRSVAVEIVVENDADDRSAFELTYNADHQKQRLALETVEPQYDDHAPVGELAAAAELADDAVHAWLKDVGKDLRLDNRLSSPGVRGRAAVHTALEVEG